MTKAKWFCGVTTAPRRQPTISRCVASLRTAGFDVTVFAEPGSCLPDDVTVVENHKRLGVWDNWLQAAEWAVASEAHGFTHALIVQDDIETHPDTLRFLDYCFGSGPAGIYSIYTPAAYSHENGNRMGRILEPGLQRIQIAGQRTLWGACGLAYDLSTLAKITEHPIAESWMGADGKKKHRGNICNSDVAIGAIAAAIGMSFYFIDPSPAAHIAKYSTIPGHGGNDPNQNRNAIRIADPTKPLIDQVFVR